MRTQNSKYKLLLNDTITIDGIKLYRIKSVKDDEIGGYVEGLHNLSELDSCWIYNDAKVFGNAKVFGDAKIFGEAKVYGSAQICDNARVCDNAEIFGYALISDNVKVFGEAKVYDNVIIRDNTKIFCRAQISGNTLITGDIRLFDDVKICGDTEINGNLSIHKDSIISSNNDYFVFKNNWSSNRYFTYTKSNKLWHVGCFCGTGEELIKKAYLDSVESGRNYEIYVRFVETQLTKF